MSRRSYRNLMALPAWGLFSGDGELVASVRAEDAWAAREIFVLAGLQGQRVKRL